MKGKPDAQRMLYAKHSSMVYAVCFRYSKNAEDANDILQESFINVFKNLKNYKSEGSFEGWIRKITVNCAIRHYHNTMKRIDTGDLEVNVDISGYSDVIDKMSAQELLEMINQLPNGYRIVFNMYAIEGYSHKEIGEQLGISESSSRSQLTRARKVLMEMLEVPVQLKRG